ncbi:MAG: hypothetical protein V1799_03505 [bacterium]
MHRLELYVIEDNPENSEVRNLLHSLITNFFFEYREITLTSDHPLFERFRGKTPLIIVDGKHQLSSPITREVIIQHLLSPEPIQKRYLFGRIFEVIGFCIIVISFIFGLRGDIQTDLTFFLGGMVIFAIGWLLEKSSVKNKPVPILPSSEDQKRNE